MRSTDRLVKNVRSMDRYTPKQGRQQKRVRKNEQNFRVFREILCSVYTVDCPGLGMAYAFLYGRRSGLI